MADEVVNQHVQAHLSHLTNKKAFVVPMADLIVGYSHYVPISDVNIDLTYINTCPDDCDVIIIDYTTNYTRCEIEEDTVRLLGQHHLSKPWLILTADFKYYNQVNDHIVYYPIHLIDGLDKGTNTEIEIKNHRTHNICFLTFHFHWHRLIILLELYRHYKFDSCLVNLPKLESLTSSQAQSLENASVYLSAEEKTLLEEMFSLAPLVADTTDSQIEIVNIENRAFFDSYINIFTESDYPKPFVTEKSVKPFLSGQFFAVLGNLGAYSHLKELGFDLFEEYLPMPQVTEIRDAARELIDSTNRLISNITTVWDETYPRRLHNYNLSRSAVLRDKLCFRLQEHLNSM